MPIPRSLQVVCSDLELPTWLGEHFACVAAKRQRVPRHQEISTCPTYVPRFALAHEGLPTFYLRAQHSTSVYVTKAYRMSQGWVPMVQIRGHLKAETCPAHLTCSPLCSFVLLCAATLKPRSRRGSDMHQARSHQGTRMANWRLPTQKCLNRRSGWCIGCWRSKGRGWICCPRSNGILRCCSRGCCGRWILGRWTAIFRCVVTSRTCWDCIRSRRCGSWRNGMLGFSRRVVLLGMLGELIGSNTKLFISQTRCVARSDVAMPPVDAAYGHDAP